MKIYILLISVLFISSNIFAQEPDSILVESWSVVDSNWEKSILSVYTYSNDQLSLYVGKHYETTTGDWINEYRREFEYSAEGYLLQATAYIWDEGVSDWYFEKKAVFINNAAGNAITITESLFLDGDWEPAKLSENTYNADGLLEESIRKHWDSMDNEYHNSFKFMYTYDLNGNPTNQINQTPQGSEWVNTAHVIKQYTDFNAEEIVVRQIWNTETNDWTSIARRTYTYNPDQSVLHLFYEIHTLDTEEWHGNKRENYTNNPNGTLHQIVAQVIAGVDYWENSLRSTMFYGDPTQVSSVNPLEVGVYPNPSSAVVNIQLGENAVRSTYTITDMSGKIIANDSFYGSNTQVSINQFAAGIYLLEIVANGKTGIVKLVRD